ncbi:MAG: cyclic pyranopterin monophosphate synthase MoaC [Methylohalobius sp. ZOD2]|nr:cyclic pyranopterin monophosphate synthase MoaC [Methylothermaceae bacterium]
MTKLTHFNARGHAHMVDVGDKPASKRSALAEGYIEMHADTLNMILEGGHKKGDVLGIARIAGIMASKKTADLIPLCHPIALTKVELELIPQTERQCVRCLAKVETTAPTGVEMEALMAVQTALLTIYDMCKSVDRGMTMHTIRLLEKNGGRSGLWRRD